MQAECHLKDRKTNKKDEKSAKVTQVSDVTVDTLVGALIAQAAEFFYHLNLVSNELMSVKFPPRRDNEAGVSSVRPSSSLSD